MRISLVVAVLVLAAIAAVGGWAAITRYSSVNGWAERAAIPWGVMVPSYAFFASSAAGLAVIAAILVLWRGSEEDAALTARHLLTLSFSLLIPAWIIVFEDLGRPDHGFWLIASWHSSSRIAWMPVFYALLAVPELLLLVYLIRAKTVSDTVAKLLALLTIAGGLGLELNLGQVFGSAVGIPSLADARLGLLFAVTALGLGGAWAIVGAGAALRLRGEDRALSIAWRSGAVAVAASMAIAGFSAAWLAAYGSVSEPVKALLEELSRGSHAAVYYGVEVGLGYIAAPVIALYSIYRRSPRAAALAAVFALAAGFAEKYSLIVGAEAARLKAPVYGAIPNPYQLLYSSVEAHAEPVEVLAVVGAAALGLLVFIVLEQVLALGSREQARFIVFRR